MCDLDMHNIVDGYILVPKFSLVDRKVKKKINKHH